MSNIANNNTKNITIGLLATGNEIVEGDILNTNCQNIARILSDHALPICLHVSTSDKDTDIVEGLRFLLTTHSVIIITGGLGPTSDDRTRFALSTVIGKELIFDEPSWQHICVRYQSLLKVMPSENNRQQALFPQGARILPNKNGTAAGCSVVFQHKTIYMLPGPPNECLPLFHEFVLPELLKNYNAPQKIKLRWRILGAIESEIAALIDEAMQPFAVTTGYRIDYPYLEIKIYVDSRKNIATIKNLLNKILEPYLINTEANRDDDRSASELLREKLLSLPYKIIIDDRATSGRLETALVTPATRAHLQFNPTQEISDHLYVEITGLTEFWHNHQPPTETSITLKFTRHNVSKEITVKFPYRNPLVLNFAVEHACLQILRFLQ